MGRSTGETFWVGCRRKGTALARGAALLRRAPLAIPLGAVFVLVSTSGSPAAAPTIEAGGGASGYFWSPSHADVTAGGSLGFKNSSASVPHGVSWSSGPETPKCSGVPIDDGTTDWNGTCTFAQAGTYTFKCPIHPTEM